MKHLIDTAEKDSGEVYAVFSSDTTMEKGETFLLHRPEEHPECPECRIYLGQEPERHK